MISKPKVNILNQGMAAIAQSQAESNNALIYAVQNPPPREVVRDSNGNITGVL
jgi:hypothetical protein